MAGRSSKKCTDRAGSVGRPDAQKTHAIPLCACGQTKYGDAVPVIWPRRWPSANPPKRERSMPPFASRSRSMPQSRRVGRCASTPPPLSAQMPCSMRSCRLSRIPRGAGGVSSCAEIPTRPLDQRSPPSRKRNGQISLPRSRAAFCPRTTTDVPLPHSCGSHIASSQPLLIHPICFSACDCAGDGSWLPQP